MTDVVKNRGTKESQNIFPLVRALHKSSHKLLNRRKHQEFFAHLFNEGDSPDAKLQKKILSFRYVGKLANDD